MIPFRNSIALPCILAAAFMASAAALADGGAAPSIIDGIAAEVDGETITISEVMREVRQLAAMANVPPNDREGMMKLFDEARDALIERQLILHAYEAGEQKLPDWVVENRVSEIVEERFGGDRAKLASALARERLTVEEWRDRIREEMVIASMRQLNIDRLVQICPGDVKAFFETNSAAYAISGPVRVAMIQLAPLAGEDDDALMARAKTLCEEIAKSGDFDAAARKNSIEAHAKKGGDWGFVDPEEEFRADIAQAVMALGEGEVSAPVQTPAGVFIMKKIAVRPDGRATLADVREQIEGDLKKAEADRLHREWIERLRADARIKVYQFSGENR